MLIPCVGCESQTLSVVSPTFQMEIQCTVEIQDLRSLLLFSRHPVSARDPFLLTHVPFFNALEQLKR